MSLIFLILSKYSLNTSTVYYEATFLSYLVYEDFMTQNDKKIELKEGV